MAGNVAKTQGVLTMVVEDLSDKIEVIDLD